MLGGLRLVGAGGERVAGEHQRGGRVGVRSDPIGAEGPNRQRGVGGRKPGDEPVDLAERRAGAHQLDAPLKLVGDDDRELQDRVGTHMTCRASDGAGKIVELVGLAARNLVGRHARPFELGRDGLRLARDGTRDQVLASVVHHANHDDVGAGGAGGRLRDRGERLGEALRRRDARTCLCEGLERRPRPLDRGTGHALRLI